MHAQFRAPRAAIEILPRIGSIPPDKIGELEKALASKNGGIYRPEELTAIAREFVEDLPLADSIVRQILSFLTARFRLEASADEMADSLAKEIPNAIETEKERSLAQDGLKVFSRLAGLPGLQRSARAIDLLYDCSNLVKTTRIVTDVRPLFTPDARNSDGAVVVHTLRIEYRSAESDQEISFSVDEADLADLRKQCDRALKKGVTAREQYCDKTDKPVMAPIETNHHA